MYTPYIQSDGKKTMLCEYNKLSWYLNSIVTKLILS